MITDKVWKLPAIVDRYLSYRAAIPMAQEQIAARIHETGLAPARDRDMFGDEHPDAVRPAALDARAVDPRNAFERGAQCVEIDGEEPGAAERRDHFLDLHRRDALKLAADFHLADRRFFVDVDHPAAGRVRQPGAPYRFSETPWRMRGPAPLLGQHNQEVFGNRLRHSPTELENLSRAGVI